MRSELIVMFCSPIAWLILIVFAFQVGMDFTTSLEYSLRSQELGYGARSLSAQIFSGYSGLYTKLLNHLYLYIPLFTMGLMSRELSSGSIKLLYSSPVSNNEIILGKYLASIVYSVMLCTLLIFPIICTSFSIVKPDIPLMLTGMFGVFVTIAAYAAIGLFMSTITKYQVVAVVGTLAVLALLNFIGGVGQEHDFVRDITYWLSISGRSRSFLSGIISTNDLLYFMLIIFMFLGLSYVKLQGERLKLSISKRITKYGIVVLSALFVGYISSLPHFKFYLDTTRMQRNTLTDESKGILEKLDGPMTITTYVNYLDDTYSDGAPRNRIRDIAEFDQYTRFKPEIKMKYVYYYGKGTSKYGTIDFENRTVEDIMDERCKYSGKKKSDFLTNDEVLKLDDIASENGRFVRVISANNKKTKLRLYEDNYKDPFEAQISTALKTLYKESPTVGFIVGHKERGSSDMSERGYGSFAKNNTFRYSLLNGGFHVVDVELSASVSPKVNIIVLADPRVEFTEEEKKNLFEYIDRGGNILILGEPKRQHILNPIIAKLGLKLSDGIIVNPSSITRDDIVAANITEDAKVASTTYTRYANYGYSIVTPSAAAVEVIDSTKGFNITEILKSNSEGSWIELETTDFINEKSKINSEIGEKEQSNSIMLYLTRQINNKEQRIFVIGDADCISTLELSTDRPGFRSSNFTLITETFRNLSYEEFPVQSYREPDPDNKVTATNSSISAIKAVLMFIIPALLTIACIVLLIRRKRN